MTIAEGADKAGAKAQPWRLRWEQAFRSADLLLPVKATVMIMVTYGDLDGNNIRPSVERLSRDTGKDERTVRRHIDAAEAAGWLVKAHPNRKGIGRTQAQSYRLEIPDQRTPVPGDRPGEDGGEGYREPFANPSGSLPEALTEGSLNGDHRTSVTAPPDICDATTGHPCPHTPARPHQVPLQKDGAGASGSPSSSLAPRRGATAGAASRAEPRIWPRGKPTNKPLTEHQRNLERASPLIDQLDADTVTDALDKFAAEMGRVAEWARERVIEHARIKVPVHKLSAEQYDQFQRHVYYWCLRNFVKNGNWPPILAEPVNDLSRRQSAA